MSYQARLAAFAALSPEEQRQETARLAARAIERASSEPCPVCGRSPADGCERWCIEAERGARRCDAERDDG